MNNDAYKLKYLKYKERYLELKEISGGAMAGVGGDKSVEAATRQLRFLRELTTKIEDALRRNIRYTDSRGNSKLVKQYVMKTRDRVNFLPVDLNIAVNKIFDELKFQGQLWSNSEFDIILVSENRSHDMTSYEIISSDIVKQDTISQHVLSYHVILDHIISYLIMVLSPDLHEPPTTHNDTTSLTTHPTTAFSSIYFFFSF